ncbi:MAG: phosphatidylinositol transfer protein [Myxococcota bacterium]
MVSLLLAWPLAACGDDTHGGGVVNATDTHGATSDSADASVGADTAAEDSSVPVDSNAPADTLVADDTGVAADTLVADGTVADDTATPVDTTTPVDSTTPVDTTTPTDTTVAASCPPPACNAALPDLGATSDWNNLGSIATTVLGGDRHRGRDLYLREGDDQWALAKFAYGALDSDLKGEDVDIWLLRDCGTTWELLGTATTTNDGDHATVEGVEDSGGWVYFKIPTAKALGLGRHRLVFVVKGDHTLAEQFIEVLPADARFVVTDVDGTQTESETAEFTAIFLGSDPAAQPHGAEALTAFAARGYHIFYLTARPEWLTAQTHTWLDAHGYPPGEVHTTWTFTGAFSTAAETFKTDELDALLARFAGGVAFGIGNTATDEAAYENVGIPADHAYLYQFDPTSSGTRIDDYANLVGVANAQPELCE